MIRPPVYVEMDNPPRRFARTEREAFRNWPENCMGVEKPIPVGRRPLWWRIANFIKEIFRAV